MKTAWLIVLVMAVAAVYVFDVAGARRPMDDAYATVVEQLSSSVEATRRRLPDVR